MKKKTFREILEEQKNPRKYKSISTFHIATRNKFKVNERSLTLLLDQYLGDKKVLDEYLTFKGADYQSTLLHAIMNDCDFELIEHLRNSYGYSCQNASEHYQLIYLKLNNKTLRLSKKIKKQKSNSYTLKKELEKEANALVKQKKLFPSTNNWQEFYKLQEKVHSKLALKNRLSQELTKAKTLKKLETKLDTLKETLEEKDDDNDTIKSLKSMCRDEIYMHIKSLLPTKEEPPKSTPICKPKKITPKQHNPIPDYETGIKISDTTTNLIKSVNTRNLQKEKTEKALREFKKIGNQLKTSTSRLFCKIATGILKAAKWVTNSELINNAYDSCVVEQKRHKLKKTINKTTKKAKQTFFKNIKEPKEPEVSLKNNEETKAAESRPAPSFFDDNYYQDDYVNQRSYSCKHRAFSLGNSNSKDLNDLHAEYGLLDYKY